MKKFLIGIGLLLIVLSPVLAQEATTPVPELEVLTLENASRLQPIGRVGLGWISDLIWSSDNQLMAVANAVGVWVYDIDHLEQAKQLFRLDDVTHIAFDSSGSTLAAGSQNGDVQLWSLEDGRLLFRNKEQGKSIESITLNNREGWIGASSKSDMENVVSVWEIATGKTIFTYESPSALKNLLFSPDGTRFVASEISEEIASITHLWRIEDHNFIEVGLLAGGKDHLGFSSDNALLIGVSANEIAVWDITTLKLVSKFRIAAPINAITFEQQGQDNQLFALNDFGLYIWNLSTRTAIKAPSEEECCYFPSGFLVVLSPDAKQFAVATRPEIYTLENKVDIFDAANSQLLDSIGGIGEPQTMIFGPNRSLVIVESDKHTVRLWDTDFTSMGRLIHFDTQAIGLAADKFKSVAITSDDNVINMPFFHVTNLQTEAEFIAHAIDFDTRQPASVALSPDGSLLAIGDCEKPVEFYNECEKGYVELRDTNSGDIVKILEGHTGVVSRLLFSNDGSLLASAQVSNSGEVRIWDVSSGTLLTQIRGHKITLDALAFSPDGKTIATGGCDEAPGPCIRGDIILWDAHSGERLGTLVGHTNNVFDVAFSPDGHLLFSSSHEGEIRLWDVQNHSTVAIYQNDTYTLRMKLSGDGTLLAVSRLDGVIQLWGVPTA